MGEKLVLKFLGTDDWSHPVYETPDGQIFKDTNCGDGQLALCTASDFYGEPNTAIEHIEKYKGMTIEITGRENEPTPTEKFNYQMLSRLQMDCKYYLGHGNRNKKHLWAGDEAAQIEEMKRLYNAFSEDKKPEWLTWEDIIDYERKMIQVSKDVSDMVETIVNIPDVEMEFKIKSNKPLDEETIQSIVDLSCGIFWNDARSLHYSVDTKLKNGLWLENIFYNNELTKASAIILN